MNVRPAAERLAELASYPMDDLTDDQLLLLDFADELSDDRQARGNECPNGPDEDGGYPCEPSADGSCVTCGYQPAADPPEQPQEEE